ncbi:MAG: TIGR02266 family protein [Deltaproteobacteria bacterium]|nr:TIGR02266 family protein [Deltaproteobacteria bacterium]
MTTKAIPALSVKEENDQLLVTRERRKDPRYLLQLAITMQGENNFYTGLSENISEGGIFIATQTVLKIGTRVELEFTLPHFDVPIRVEGTVQWIREPEAMSLPGHVFGCLETRDVPAGMGIRFDVIDQDAVYAIRKFMTLRLPDFYDE